MNSIGQEGAVYTDFSQLESLKAQAQANPDAALEEVAQQFESLFLQMMLKSMRDATMKSDLFGSDQMESYQSMADQQIALTLSQQGGMGLARVLVEQMQVRGQVPNTQDSEAALDGDTLDEVTPVMPLTKSRVPAKAFQLEVANPNAINLKG
ncbi:MAG: rod-binding protein [Luminiphilus sp.]|jgi:Rod binding domain-containing protein